MKAKSILEIQNDIDKRNEYIEDKSKGSLDNTLDIEEYLNNIIDDANSISYYFGVFQAYSSLAVYFLQHDNYTRGLEYLENAKRLIEDGKVSETEYPLLYNYYLIYYAESSENMEKAIKCYKLGIKYAEKFDDHKVQLFLKSNFAVMNIGNENYGVAEKLFYELISYNKANDDKIALMYNYENIADIYLKTSRISLAKKYYLKAYKQGFNLDDAIIIRETTRGLATIYLKEKDTKMALKLLKRSLKYGKRNDYIRIEVNCKLEISRIYYLKKQIRKSLELLLAARKQVDELNSYSISKKYYKLLSKVSESNEKYELAYKAFKKYHKLDKAINSKKGDLINDEAIHREYDNTIKQLKTIAKIGKDITLKNNLDEVVREILERLRDVMKIDAVAIAEIVNAEIVFNYFLLEEVKIPAFRRRLNPVTTLSAWVVENSRDLVSNNLDEEFNQYIEAIDRTYISTKNNKDGKKTTQSAMYSPLKFKNEIIGVFTIQSYEKDAYAVEEYEIFKIISSYVAIALKNVLQANDLIEMTIRDSLTGLYNRRGFTDFFRKILIEKSESIENISLIMLDLDFFKKVNDIHGHLTGDYVLREVGQLLLSLFNEVEYPSRLGGEEFSFIIINKTFDEVCNIAELVRRKIEELELIVDDEKISITSSLGVAYTENLKEIEYNRMYYQADNMLYRAKEEGRNKVLSIEF